MTSLSRKPSSDQNVNINSVFEEVSDQESFSDENFWERIIFFDFNIKISNTFTDILYVHYLETNKLVKKLIQKTAKARILLIYQSTNASG